MITLKYVCSFNQKVSRKAQRFLPALDQQMSSPSNPDKKGFWHCAFFNYDPRTGSPVKTPLEEYELNDTRILLNDFLPEGITETWGMVVSGLFTSPDYSGPFEFGLIVAGKE